MTRPISNNYLEKIPYEHSYDDLKNMGVTDVFWDGKNEISIYGGAEGVCNKRTINSTLYIGCAGEDISQKQLWATFGKFCQWRRARFGDRFLWVRVYGVCGPQGVYIHEEYQLFWRDADGGGNIGIDEALEDEGIGDGLISPRGEEYSAEARRVIFEWISMAMWMEIVGEELGFCSGMELKWPDEWSKFKHPSGQKSVIDMIEFAELCHVSENNYFNTEMLEQKVDELEADFQAVLDKRQAKNVNWEQKEKLEEEMFAIGETLQTYRWLWVKGRKNLMVIGKVLDGHMPCYQLYDRCSVHGNFA